MSAADPPATGAGFTGTDADPVAGAAGLVGTAAADAAAGLVGTTAPGPAAGLVGTTAPGPAAGLVGAAAPNPAAGLVGAATPGATARPDAVPRGGVGGGDAAGDGFASDRFTAVGVLGGVGGCGRRTCASGTGTRPAAGFTGGFSSPPSAEPPGR
ncbi:hypothetical protein GCM10029963_51780 [Micromonospora andamanensis]|uniref:hypothetical protein n=1 Tax=Micromonospora andamanensis TaxID=1287068 RepID=UPI001A5016DB|nr:hypothetical protein [Micromonospora andamanensis]GIJ37599.1 hypothetical protein Vwe01_09240 [Micromonospora andamanensis]